MTCRLLAELSEAKQRMNNQSVIHQLRNTETALCSLLRKQYPVHCSRFIASPMTDYWLTAWMLSLWQRLIHHSLDSCSIWASAAAIRFYWRSAIIFSNTQLLLMNNWLAPTHILHICPATMDGNSNKSSLPWGISNEKLQPSSLGQISDSKLATFAVGQQKKSRFQKAREGTRFSWRDNSSNTIVDHCGNYWACYSRRN